MCNIIVVSDGATGLSPYDISIRYRKGTEHVPPDFLTRIPTYTNEAPRKGGPVIRMVSRRVFNLSEMRMQEHTLGSHKPKSVSETP